MDRLNLGGFGLNDNPEGVSTNGQQNTNDIPEALEQVNYNDGKFIEEDPKLVDHMNESRDKLTEEENKANEVVRLTPEQFSQIITANNKCNIEFTKLIQSLTLNCVAFDDCTENSYRHANAITQILEGKKAPVGFATLEPKKCLDKLLTLVIELSDKMKTHTKTMEKLIVDFGQFKKSDEAFRSDILKQLKIEY